MGKRKMARTASTGPRKKRAAGKRGHKATKSAEALEKAIEPVDNSDVGDMAEDQDGEDEWGRCLRGVVKVFCTTTRPNQRMPWQVLAQTSYTGTGCLMDGRRVLTNAHVVECGTTISVMKHGDPKRYLAKILAYGHEYDLALLEVVEEADRFWKGTVPLSCGDVPLQNSTVMILGYPSGFDSVSVTEGVVSRVMVDNYEHSGEELLKLQVDAAINSGNSGGPAIVNGALVGVVFEVQKRSQNIGFAIPSSVVNHFLRQIQTATTTDEKAPLGAKAETGGFVRYPGICSLGLITLPCENASIRAFHKLGEGEHGVVVSHVYPLSVCARKVRPGDVITAIDGAAVADDGSIDYRGTGERVKMSHAVTSKFAGDTCKLTLKRDGRTTQVSVTLDGRSPRFYGTRFEQQPQYLVWCGLVFLVCSHGYIEAEFSDGETIDYGAMPLHMQQAWYHGEKQSKDEELVILSQVLADDVCLGYLQYNNRVVMEVNGEPVKNLKALAAMFAKLNPADTPYVRIDLDRHTTIVLETAKALKAHPEILRRNHIQSHAFIRA